MAKPIQFKPELWKPLELRFTPEELEEIAETAKRAKSAPPPVKSFFDPQNPEETYEVRGILPRADIAYKAQD